MLRLVRQARDVLIAIPPLHSYLLGAWFVLDVGGQASHQEWGAAVEFLLLLWVATAGLQFFLRAMFHDTLRAGIVATAILIAMLCFEEVRQFLAALTPLLAEFKIIVPLIVCFVMATLVILRHRPGGTPALHGALNAATIIFVLWSLRPYVKEAHAFALPHGRNPIVRTLVPTRPQFASDGGDLPDIYFIVLDAYTSNQSLARYWHYDNSPFVLALRQRGFYVADGSTSRYTSTVQSIAAVLNMDTLAGNDKPFLMIRKNALTDYLRSRGYRIVNLSPFTLEDLPAFYTYFTDAKGSGAGMSFFFYHTGPGVILATGLAETMPNVNLRTLGCLVSLGRDTEPGPKFVYVHLMTPHGPFGFDRDGSIVPFLQRGGWNSMRSYLDQLIGTNALLLPVLDTILVHSRQDPIIIIQGDHGSRIVPGPGGNAEMHTIMNAYHLPEGKASLLGPSISPINSFRLVLDAYFDEKIPFVALGH